MSETASGSFTVLAPSGWEEITDSVEGDDPPFTLARSDGVGALQFSVALYTSGPVPDPSPADLAKMVVSFAESLGLDSPREVAVESSPLRLAAGSLIWGEDFLRVWQVSDGRNFAFVTYTCEFGQEIRELGECERVVRTMRFQSPDGAV